MGGSDVMLRLLVVGEAWMSGKSWQAGGLHVDPNMAQILLSSSGFQNKLTQEAQEQGLGSLIPEGATTQVTSRPKRVYAHQIEDSYPDRDHSVKDYTPASKKVAVEQMRISAPQPVEKWCSSKDGSVVPC